MTQSLVDGRARLRASLPLAIPLGLALLVFAHAATFPFVNWDDPSHFADNPLAEHPLARGWSGLFWTREIGYPAPLLVLSFALDRALFGLHPAPFHVENVALHLANVAMLFHIARRMRLSPWEACGVATLFAVHPLVVEPVCWVTGRKDVLSLAMLFAAVLLASGDPKRAGPARARRGTARWTLAQVLVLLAPLVLPRMVIASMFVAVCVWAIRPEASVRAIAARMAVPLAATIPIIVLGARQMREVGALPAPRTLDQTFADVAGAWALQLGHLLFPVDLLAYYVRERGDPPAWAMAVAALAALGWLVFAARSQRGGHVQVGTMLALLAYAPVSCVFMINRWTADSYMVLPMVGLAIALVPTVARMWPERLAAFGRAAAGAFAATLALLAFVQSSRWTSSVAVWAGSIDRYPNEAISYEHEALALRAVGRDAEANALALTIAERFPDWVDSMDDEVLAFEASGDTRRAAMTLARGVRAGNAGCIRLYWMRMIATGRTPGPDERDLVATAFTKGYDAMKAGLHDPARLERVAEVLRGEGLDAMAARAEALAVEARGPLGSR